MSTVPTFSPQKAKHLHVQSEVCPLCEQPIAGEQRAEIWARIKARRREQEAARAVEMQRQVADEVKAATEAQSRKHGEALDLLQKQLKQKEKDAEVREKQVRAQVLAEARKKHEGDLKKEQEKHAAIERHNKALAGQIAKLKEENEKKVEQAVTREIARVREVMQKDKDDALNKSEAKHTGEARKLKEKLQGLQRQLDKARADNLGDGQEVDLLNDLKQAFPCDNITTIAKGEPGADIRHEIIIKGKVCGTILYESKNRMRWATEYPAKLRKDQIAAKADHAVLAAVKFPAGARDLTIFDGVLVVNPRHVVTMAKLLRDSTVKMDKLRLSTDQRSKKRDELYKFMTSSHCLELLARQEEVTDSLVALEKRELKQHEKIWKDRGIMLKQLEKAHGDFRGEIEYIIEG